MTEEIKEGTISWALKQMKDFEKYGFTGFVVLSQRVYDENITFPEGMSFYNLTGPADIKN